MSNCASMWIAIARTEILRDRGKAGAVSTRDWDLRLLREHRETLALDKWDSRAASDFPFIIYQGRKAAGGCKPRHGRDDRKRERSSSWLSPSPMMIWLSIIAMPASTRPSAFLRLKRPHPCVREGSSAATRGEVAFHEGNIEYNRG